MGIGDFIPGLHGWHVLVLGSVTGMTLHTTFVGSVIQFRTLTRDTFATLQRNQFPVYFGLSLVLTSYLSWSTYALSKHSQAQSQSLQLYRVSAGLLAAAALGALTNLALIGPRTRKWGDLRLKLLKDAQPIPSEISRAFGRWHGASSVVNLLQKFGKFFRLQSNLPEKAEPHRISSPMASSQFSHKAGTSRLYSVDSKASICESESSSNSISIDTDLFQFQPWTIDDLPPTPSEVGAGSDTHFDNGSDKSLDNTARSTNFAPPEEPRESDSESVSSSRPSTNGDCNSEISDFDVDVFRVALMETIISVDRQPYPSLISHIVPMETVAEECFNLADSGAAAGDFSFMNSDYDEYSFQYNASSYNASPTRSITSLGSRRANISPRPQSNSPCLSGTVATVSFLKLASTIGSNDSFAASAKANSTSPNQQSFFEDVDIAYHAKASISVATTITSTIPTNSKLLRSSSSKISLSSTTSSKSFLSVDMGNLMPKNNVTLSSPLKTTPPSKRFYYFNPSAQPLPSLLTATRRTTLSPLAINTQSISTKGSPQTRSSLSFDQIVAPPFLMSPSAVSRKSFDSNRLGLLPKARSSTGLSLFSKRVFNTVEAPSVYNYILEDSASVSCSVSNGVATDADQHAVAANSESIMVILEGKNCNSEADSCSATINTDNIQQQRKVRGWRKFVQDVKAAALKFATITATRNNQTPELPVVASADQYQCHEQRQKSPFSGWAPSLSVSTPWPPPPPARNATPITLVPRLSSDLPRQFSGFPVLPLNCHASMDQQWRRPNGSFNSGILGGSRKSLDETTRRIGGSSDGERSYEIAAETMEAMDASRMTWRAFSAHARIQKSSSAGGSSGNSGEDGIKERHMALKDGAFSSLDGSSSSSSSNSSSTKGPFVGLDTVSLSEDAAYSWNDDNASLTLVSRRSAYRVDLPADVFGGGGTGGFKKNSLMDEFGVFCDGGDDNDWNTFRKEDAAADRRRRLDSESASIRSVTSSREDDADTIRVRLLQRMDVSKELERFYKDVCSGDVSVHEIAGHVEAGDY
ncbi:hypothetical protein HK100_005902 [Physocladia obscura]|uniref:TMEM205-like domain-containing protein n=1 Tax=Physocladia obscura TaxID=109957 RepID=A0AAD5T8A1_9FUNG|nr:hypothetical protein HK100_005902 [Physocladia obscura]